jgi:hypothetical protein
MHITDIDRSRGNIPKRIALNDCFLAENLNGSHVQ